MKRLLRYTLSLSVITLLSACSETPKSQFASQLKDTNSAKGTSQYALIAEPIRVSVSGEDIIKGDANNKPLLENITISSAHLSKLAATKDPFALLGFDTALLKGHDGTGDGVKLTLVSANEVTKKFGFKDNDVIIAIDKTSVKSKDALQRIFPAVAKNGKVSISIRRGFTPHILIFNKGSN